MNQHFSFKLNVNMINTTTIGILSTSSLPSKVNEIVYYYTNTALVIEIIYVIVFY